MLEVLKVSHCHLLVCFLDAVLHGSPVQINALQGLVLGHSEHPLPIGGEAHCPTRLLVVGEAHQLMVFFFGGV